MMTVSNMLVKGNVLSSSMGIRYQEATQIQAVVQDMMQDLQQGAYISSNSHKNRLEYTTYNSAGTAVKKVFGICYAGANVASTDTTCSVNSGANTTAYLKLSTDGGSTWVSPYRISAFNEYQLTGTPLFLYAHDANNCTSFTDTDANGVWLSGTDAAGVTSSCGSFTTTSPLLSSPNQATKVVLSGFQFTSSNGSPAIPRTLPTNVFMASPQGVVISTAAAVSPGVKDTPLLKSFTTNTANSLFGLAFWAYGIQWDTSRQRLIVVGNGAHNTPTVYQVDRAGVLIGSGKTLSGPASYIPVAVALLQDGLTVMVLDYNGGPKINWYNLNGSLPLTAFKTLDLSHPSNSSPSVGGASALVQSPSWGMLYDPKYPDEVFVLGTDPADGAYKIFEISTITGALATTVIAGGKLSLPAAFDATHIPYGLSQEPTTGDFLVTRDYVYGSAPNHSIDIYRITSSGTATSFSVNVDDLGSTATTTAGGFGLSYNPESNHFFLSDILTGKMYEIYPSVIISPRS